MTPDYKPPNEEDPSYYISGGYDPYQGFLPGYYTKKYPGMASGGSVAKYGAGGEAMFRAAREEEFAPVGGISRTDIRSPFPEPPPGAVMLPPPRQVDPLYGSASNLPYSGSGAEQLSAYMQNLNRSFIPEAKPVAPPKPVTTPTTPSRPTTRELGAYADILSGLGGLGGLGGMMGINFDPSMFDQVGQRGSSGSYSRPLFRMTADEVAAEDAARAAQPPPMMQPPPMAPEPSYGDFSGIDFSSLSPYAGNYSPPEPAYTPPSEPREYVQPTPYNSMEFYQPPAMTPFSEPEREYIPRTQEDVPVYQEPIYQPPAPVYQPPAMTPFSEPEREYIPTPQEDVSVYQEPVYQPPAPVYQPPAPIYQPPAPVYQPPAMTPFSEPEREPELTYSPAEREYIPTPQASEPLEYADYYPMRSDSQFIPEFRQNPMDYGLGGFEQNYDDFGSEYNFGFAKGGVAKRRRKRKQRPVAGKLVSGKGDGMSDSIKANIDGNQEARLTDGEFVIPADVVSHLGNGSTDAGSKKLYDMMARVRKARTGRAHQAPQVNVDGMMPR